MKQYFLQSKLSAFVLLIFVLTASAIRAQGFSPQTEARLQAVLDRFQAQYGVGGMSAAINVDGLAVWEGATGYAYQYFIQQPPFTLLPDGEPFETNTLSRIYSITKVFTAALTLELANEGLLNLNDPVSKYFPIQTYNAQLDPSVTIKQLLAHESGYADFLTNPMLLGAVATNPYAIWQPVDVLPFAGKKYDPGVTRFYSSTNYIVLGIIIEAATGTPVEQLYRERFFEPLGLETMYLAGREPNVSGGTLAAPHESVQLLGIPLNQYTNFGPFFPFDAIESIAWTTGGIVSDVGDLAEWGNALFGGRATSKKTLNLMLNSIAATPDADGDYLGFGLWRSTKIDENDVFIGHNGSAPGYRSLMFYQPDRKMTIAILSNYSGANLYEVAAALYDVLPDFIGGNDNRKEAKIVMCWNGRMHTVARPAAKGFIGKGAYLGGCETAIASRGKNKSLAMPKQPADVVEMTVYPNPSGSTFHFQIKAQESGHASLRIYDISGKLMGVPFNGMMQKGEQRTVTYDGSRLSKGTYFSQLQTASGTTRQKLVVSN